MTATKVKTGGFGEDMGDDELEDVVDIDDTCGVCGEDPENCICGEHDDFAL